MINKRNPVPRCSKGQAARLDTGGGSGRETDAGERKRGDARWSPGSGNERA